MAAKTTKSPTTTEILRDILLTLQLVENKDTDHKVAVQQVFLWVVGWCWWQRAESKRIFFASLLFCLLSIILIIVVVATSGDRRGKYLGACAPCLLKRIGGKRDLSVVMLVELLREQIRPLYPLFYGFLS